MLIWLSRPPETQSAPFFPPTTTFAVDPNAPAVEWVRDHPDDPLAPVVGSRIAAQSQALWLDNPDPSAVRDQVSGLVSAAESQHAIPVLVTYAIPKRDCRAGVSGGGAQDFATYRDWVDNVAQGLGTATAVVVVEPDALAELECLAPPEQADRIAGLAYAGTTLHTHDPHARVYFDAGNSHWKSARTMVDRLRQVGVGRSGDGIALNVANFNPTSNEVRYGNEILRRLSDPRLAMVIDTSRNGNGPSPAHQFCDPPGRRLGESPTADTRTRGVDAYLWIKHPGQSDGCRAAPGQFLPDYAYQLSNG